MITQMNAAHAISGWYHLYVTLKDMDWMVQINTVLQKFIDWQSTIIGMVFVSGSVSTKDTLQFLNTSQCRDQQEWNLTWDIKLNLRWWLNNSVTFVLWVLHEDKMKKWFTTWDYIIH